MDVQVSMPPPPPPPPPPPAFFAETTTAQLTAPTPPPPQSLTATTTTVSVASPPTQERIWLHPWTVNEMRENASRWSLAGDAGVLLYLEQFSDKLTQRADAIQQHLNQTVNAVKSTHTRVLNCLNEFTSLANTQFIENRVYDEDETASTTTTASKKDEQSTEKTNASNVEAQEKVLQRYVEAIQYGLAILDTHFERVETKLDSNQNGNAAFVEDDEDGGVPLEPILEPKDPYIFRPLPHLIGTTEFMQDDYVGLGDLLTLHDEEVYGLEQIEKVETDSALSSSDDNDDEEEDDDKDFQAQISPAPIVPAGASRPDLANRPPPPTSVLTDSEDEDDPFGINKNLPKFDNISSKQPVEDDDLFSDEPKPLVLPVKQDMSALESGDDEESAFGITIQKAPQAIIKNNDDPFDDQSSTSSEEPDQPEQSIAKPKHLSALEEAVLRRRRAMGDPDVPPDDGNNDEKIVQKPPKKSNEPSSSPSINKAKSQPSSSTISNLTSQPLTTPSKISERSIFGEHEDDDDDENIFSAAPKLTSTTIIDPKPPLKMPQKKEKDLFDEDSDEGGSLFSPTEKKTVPSSIPPKKTETTPAPQPPVTHKPLSIPPADESDEDELFGTKKTPAKPTPRVAEKKKSPSSDEELFIPKSQPAPIKNDSDDKDPLFTGPSPVPKVVAAPVLVPPVKKPAPTADEDSDDPMFGISTKPSSTRTTIATQKVVSPIKLDDQEDDEIFSTSATKPKALPTEIPKVVRAVYSDEDEVLFPPPLSQFKLPPPVDLAPLPPVPSIKTNVYDDPLGVQKPVETVPPPVKTSSVSIKPPVPDDDVADGESSPVNRELNTAAVKDGEKINVKDLSSRLKIAPGAFKPGAWKPSARPNASSNTEESPKPSVIDDDDLPVQNSEPAPSTVKKLPTLDSDSDEEGLFNNKKKETPKASTVEQKEKPNGKSNITDLSSRLKANLIIHAPGAPPKPIINENESNNNTSTTSKDESPADKTMINIMKDRAKVPMRSRAPPTRKVRSAVAASTDENDDLFASPKATNTSTSPPAPVVVPVIPPTAVPVIPPPSVAAVPPPVPVTGLLAKPAAIAAKQTNFKEKKKFSLFDSDDSDLDELLFGSNNKKNKSSAVSKPKTTPSATTKSTTKPSLLPLEDDDDFLSRRPTKKNTKSVDNDDIFAGVKTNKPKKDWSIMSKSITDETDDIFKDTSTKPSATAKPKAINAKNKPTKDLDDIFDDPLNISSKR